MEFRIIKKYLILVTLTLITLIKEIDSAAITCPGPATLCNSTRTCIEHKYICDGDLDCEDGEDEVNCEVKESGCGDNSYRTESTGVITSMNYPFNYSNQAHCQWHISSEDNTPLQLEFVDTFDVEKPRHDQCIYDFVSLYQENPLIFLGRFCGASPPGPIKLNSSKVLVEFQSDGQTTGRGFKLRWTSVKSSSVQLTRSDAASQCRGQFEYGGDLGHISSPNFGQPYETPINCRWLVVVTPGYRISLQFSSLDVGRSTLDGCVDGWLEIYDGPDDGAPFLGRYCGDAMPTALLTSSNLLYLQMSADNNTNGNVGFKATYTSVYIVPQSTTTIGPLPPGCDGTAAVLRSPSGHITTPFYNHVQPYLDGLTCEWILLAPAGHVFSIEFMEFDLEQAGGCDSDYLRIYDDDDSQLLQLYNVDPSLVHNNDTVTTNMSDVTYLTEISNLCGMMLPYSVESNSSAVILKFHSDDQYGGYGFNLTYRTKLPTVKCSPGQFQCGSFQCVQMSEVCDGHVNCQDGGDELLCPSLKCGLPAHQTEVSRIVGGTEAADGAWPWTLSIVDTARPGHICGATLIHPQWAVTAAHCFERVYSRNYEQFSLVGGRHNLLITDHNEQWRPVADVFMNRDYWSGTSVNDIAMIKVKQPFNLTDHVDLLCLPGHSVAAGTPCYITGWGETLGTCCVNQLKQALVPIINSSVCGGPDYYGDRLKEHMMCAGYPDGGVDSCDGDSGGPLACQKSTGGRHWELQGITSWGLLCASAKSPGVYTVVYDYITWIRQTISLNSV